MTSLICIGAHPDDAELMAGGLATLFTLAGGRVCFVSVTNGEAGHHELGGDALALRRQLEATAAASLIGADALVLENRDAELMPSLEVRHQLVRIIRDWKPDLVVTHRPNDYHPDHRYTGQLTLDAMYLLTVPNVVRGSLAMADDPVLLYGSDNFQRPYPFMADLVIDIDLVIETKLDLLDCHESQYYEWLPYHDGKLSQVPHGRKARRTWLRRDRDNALRMDADRFRHRLVSKYGAERGERIRYAEAYEWSEHGRQMAPEDAAQLIPF